MQYKKILISILLGIVFIQSASAAHFIIGYVNDSISGVEANDYVITLWNPANGQSDNVTDTIGPNGNSGADNFYMIDCELLQTSCSIGDTINVKVFNNGSDYVSRIESLTVTGAGFDAMPNLIINSKPSVNLITPVNYANKTAKVNFSCDSSDLDSNLKNVTLYGNWSGGWHANETIPISGSTENVNFTKILPEGMYEWNCLATDNLSISQYATENHTLTVDLTPPVISSIYLNETTNQCGTSTVLRINCTATDALTNIDTVFIESTSTSGSVNHSTSLLSGNTYYTDILLDELGDWIFNCIANDSAGNSINLSYADTIEVFSGTADLTIFSTDIEFGNLDPIENEPVIINATIYNNGCSNGENFLVGFFNGNPDLGGTQINGNKTISVSSISNTTTNITWPAEIGTSNIFVSVDVSNLISESNETNNIANNSITVGAWQDIYGNVTIDKLLANQNIMNMSLWLNETSLSGNLFITDSEANIDWTNLAAIGKNKSGDDTTNDFNDIDNLLSMTTLDDSVSNTFTTDGNTPKDLSNFFVHKSNILNVPIINSTDSENFITGLLWDTDDDDTDGEFSQDDSEDLVVVTKVKKATQGAYGIYDYEITIPARLREYNPADSNEVFIYFDLN